MGCTFKRLRIILSALLGVAFALCPVEGARAAVLPDGAPTTIDRQLQTLAERLLSNKQGAVCAIEPQTGRVLALASSDLTFSPVNRAVGMAYNPASTFKVPQALMLLTDSAITAKTTYPCRSGFTTGKIHIGCHPHRAPTSVIQALSVSCNSFFCKAFQEMIDNRELYPTQFAALNRWADFMHSLGFGRRLGIDVAGEEAGVVPDSAYMSRNFRRWNGTTLMWNGMGQGEVHATPLQLCNLAAIVANRGWWVAPHVQEATFEHPLPEAYREVHEAMGSEETYEIVVRGMRGAVTSGTAAALGKSAFKICGKTGTAENRGDDHSVFIGFAPMDDPAIALCVYVENAGFGADFAAPLAALLIEQYLAGELSDASEQRAKRIEEKIILPPLEDDAAQE